MFYPGDLITTRTNAHWFYACGGSESIPAYAVLVLGVKRTSVRTMKHSSSGAIEMTELDVLAPDGVVYKVIDHYFSHSLK